MAEKARPVLGIVIAVVIVGTVITLNLMKKDTQQKIYDEIEYRAEDTEITQKLMLRYAQLKEKSILTLEESKEQKEIYQTLKKKFKELGPEGEKLWYKFLRETQ